MNRSRGIGPGRAALGMTGVMIAVLVTGCFNPFSPKVAPNRGVSKAPPAPSSAEGVVRLFEWCWNNQDIDQYQEIFTDDFKFQFGATDTAGNAFRDRALTRGDEIDTERHLFVGGSPTERPANKISLVLDQNLIAQTDSRPGKQDFTYHREILTQVVLKIETDAESFQVTGAARFFVIRGDSAIIPGDMLQKGFRRDSKRWYIERWEDETVGSVAQAAARHAPGPEARAVRASIAAEPAAASLARTAAPGEAQNLNVTWGFVKRTYYPRR
jgi:hypothetical protein